MSCEYRQTREETIDAYVRNALAPEQRDAFDIHLYTCDACFEMLRRRQALAAVVRRQGSADKQAAIRPLRTPILFLKKAGYLAAAAVVLIVAGQITYQALLPSHYDAAKLTVKENENLRLGVRGGSSPVNPAFSAGAQALREAETKRFFFIPAFNHTRIDTAISRFRGVYHSSENAFYKSSAAYFLGKAYLMRAQPDSACAWFGRLLKQRAAFYREEARVQQKTLACSGN